MILKALSKKFVIYKSSREPREDSYFGPTWDKAGIRDRYKPTYDTAEEAQALADLLSASNPVGFLVSQKL